MYSFRISFWIVPLILCDGTPCSSATTIYIARRIIAGALIVIEVDTVSNGMPENNCRISSNEEIETPTLPTSPSDNSSSASNPNWVGKSKATDKPFWPRSSNNLNLSLVSLALEKPAYCLIVHNLERYIVSCIPLVYGGTPAVFESAKDSGISIPERVFHSPFRSSAILVPIVDDSSKLLLNHIK